MFCGCFAVGDTGNLVEMEDMEKEQYLKIERKKECVEILSYLIVKENIKQSAKNLDLRE